MRIPVRSLPAMRRQLRFGSQSHTQVCSRSPQLCFLAWQPNLFSGFLRSADLIVRSSPRPISTGQLNTLLRFHLRPIYLVVSQGPYQFLSVGSLILRLVSRLDAFSVYPFRTWLLSSAPGGTTHTPAVRPSRSSRTKHRSSQTSFAHDGYGPNCLTTF